MALRTCHEPSTDLLLIAGRSGVGKSAVSAEVSSQLKRAGVAHCQMDGDWLDLCYPQAPAELFDRNFRDVWRNYQSFGCNRLIYSNWASIKNAERIAHLMGTRPRIIGVLLLCTDETALQRLCARTRRRARMAPSQPGGGASRGPRQGLHHARMGSTSDNRWARRRRHRHRNCRPYLLDSGRPINGLIRRAVRHTAYLASPNGVGAGGREATCPPTISAPRPGFRRECGPSSHPVRRGRD